MANFTVILDELGIETAPAAFRKDHVAVFQNRKLRRYIPVEIRAVSLDHSVTGTLKGAAWGTFLAGPLGAAIGSMVGGSGKVTFELDTEEAGTLYCFGSRDVFLEGRKRIERITAQREQRAAYAAGVKRRVSWPLIVGMVLLPVIFVWAFLRRGYAGWVRLAAFAWTLLWVIGIASLPGAEDATPDGIEIAVSQDGQTDPAEEATPSGPTDYWVKGDQATERSRPGGPAVNTVYYRQKMTVYERRGEWYRTTEDRAAPRWTRASELTDTQPPERPIYRGPAGMRDSRIAPDAISNPGENGLTRADVDILWRGANLVLAARPECSRIDWADKSVNRPNTYYVTCDMNGSARNIFFTRAEVERDRLG